MYDVTGHSEYTNQAGGGGAHGGRPFTSSQAEEIFKQFFGGDYGGFSSFFGGDQNFSSGEFNQLSLSLSFDESVSGCSKEVSIRVQGVCERCSGSGGEPGTKPQTCPYCRGRGEVRPLSLVWRVELVSFLQEVINTGFFHMKSTCRRCHGEGKIIHSPCRQCGGRRTTIRPKTINVQIPAGVEDGQSVRVPVENSEAHILLKVSVCTGLCSWKMR